MGRASPAVKPDPAEGSPARCRGPYRRRSAALVPPRTTGFNLDMPRAAQAVSALGAAIRNENVRRVELAWGAAIAAEWAHFVALGVYAYEQGGASGVGLAGLVRLLPAAVVAPFAASLGDRFRRERLLLAMSLLGSAALAASAAAAFAGERVPVFAFATLVGPLVAGVLVAVADVGVVFVVGSAALLAAAALLARVTVEGRITLTAAAGEASLRRLASAGFRAVTNEPNARLVVALVTAQAFVRGCLNVLIVVAVFRVLHGSAADVGYL